MSISIGIVFNSKALLLPVNLESGRKPWTRMVPTLKNSPCVYCYFVHYNTTFPELFLNLVAEKQNSFCREKISYASPILQDKNKIWTRPVLSEKYGPDLALKRVSWMEIRPTLAAFGLVCADLSQIQITWMLKLFIFVYFNYPILLINDSTKEFP